MEFFKGRKRRTLQSWRLLLVMSQVSLSTLSFHKVSTTNVSYGPLLAQLRVLGLLYPAVLGRLSERFSIGANLDEDGFVLPQGTAKAMSVREATKVYKVQR
jgi:hypothetical protein